MPYAGPDSEHLRGRTWAPIGELVGQRNLATAPNTCTLDVSRSSLHPHLTLGLIALPSGEEKNSIQKGKGLTWLQETR